LLFAHFMNDFVQLFVAEKIDGYASAAALALDLNLST